MFSRGLKWPLSHSKSSTSFDFEATLQDIETAIASARPYLGAISCDRYRLARLDGEG